ncbi:hypothetical protein MRB53_011504 [Persea americana]|uniref:Uncharacterized protein n=1 Tax=Persea americana TaxID=3435 RepID=A0ACC2LV18_PERAE|nr:hypothetical protein MRB53_011504 [Persea americana]
MVIVSFVLPVLTSTMSRTQASLYALEAHGDEIPTVGSTLSSSFPAALQALQKQIGYQFQTVDLLRRAMTHPSYSRDNNKILSYLGLRTIQSTASLRLISRDPEMSPKDLDRRITEISREDACAVGATRLGLEKVVRVSEKTDVSAPVVLCGAFGAIFAALVGFFCMICERNKLGAA